MVERIMLLKLHDPAERSEVARFVRDTLVALDGVEEASVGVPADPASAKSWDVSVVMSFATEAAQTVSMASEAFGAFMDRVNTKAQVVKAWSFERLA